MNAIRITIARALWWLVRPAHDEACGVSAEALRRIREEIYGPPKDCPPATTGPGPTPPRDDPSDRASPACGEMPADVALMRWEMLRLLDWRAQTRLPPTRGELR